MVPPPNKIRKIMKCGAMLLDNIFSENIELILPQNNSIFNNCFSILCIEDEHYRIPLFFEHWIQLYLDQDFYTHFRLKKSTFADLCNEIGHLYKPIYRGGYIPLEVEKCTLITLWYLAKGEVLCSISDRFNVALSTTHEAITLILNILAILKEKYIKWPSLNKCIQIEKKNRDVSGYPGIIGAIDGTHFKLKVPLNQHDSYQDRHYQHSIAMQAICTYDLLFTNISCGYPGSLHDARILQESSVGRNIRRDPNSLFYNSRYHLVGDSAYPCEIWLMTPYRKETNNTRAQHNHNHKLSRARVRIEHAFGQLKGRWRICQYINVYTIKRAVNIIIACCVLHNYCLIKNDLMTVTEYLDERVQYNINENNIHGENKRNQICFYLNTV